MPSGGNVSLSPTLHLLYISLWSSPSPAFYPVIISRPQTPLCVLIHIAVQSFSLSISLYFHLGFALWFYHTTETASQQSSQPNPSSSPILTQLFLSFILNLQVNFLISLQNFCYLILYTLFRQIVCINVMKSEESEK